MSASQHGHADLVKIFLENGSDPLAKDKNGSQALHSASSCDHSNVVNISLDYNAEINAQNGRRKTALANALNKHHYEIVRNLLQAGADMSQLSPSLLKNKKFERNPCSYELRCVILIDRFNLLNQNSTQ